MPAVKGLKERLRDGESIICGEGYVWELERRGFVCSGDFTPQVVLDYPERVKALHEELVLAGSDVVEAFTYYGHKGKLKSVGREDDFKALNMKSLKMAREVADTAGKLMAGNICNSTTFDPDDQVSVKETKAMFQEQIEWAVEAGADFIIAETFNELAEAKLALKTIQEFGKGMPAVVTIAAYSKDTTLEGVPIPKALRELEELGADVVGINCGRGPATIMNLLKEAKKICKGPLAALPVPFRTNEKEVCYNMLTDPLTGKILWPADLECRQCSRADIRQFAQEARQLGIQYVGLCCGGTPSMLREIAEVYGRTPELSRFKPSTTNNFYLKKNPTPRGLKVKQHFFGDKFNDL